MNLVGLLLLLAAAPAFEAATLDLSDPDPEVRRAAAVTLGASGDPRAVPALIAAARGEQLLEETIHAAELEAERQEMRRMTVVCSAEARVGNGIPVTVELSLQVYAAALAALGPLSTPALEPLLTRGDETMRSLAGHALADNGDPAATPALIAAATSDDELVRTLVVKGLGARPGPEAARAIVVASLPEYLPTTVAALRAQGPHALDAAISLLASPDPHVRVAALLVLDTLADPRAVPAVTLATADPSPEVRAVATRSLAALTGGPPEP